MTETQSESKSKLERIREKIDLKRGLLAADYSAVHDNLDLTREAKERRLREHYERAQAEHKKLVEEAEAERNRTKTEAQLKLSTPPIPKSAKGAERETYLMSLRDATDRACKATANPKKP